GLLDAQGVVTSFYAGQAGVLASPHGLDFIPAVAAVPEPASLAPLGAGVLGLLGMRRRNA
ncbi:MAG: PEP-CTERM sorting domain-containing protein, partial [Pseudomonadota bacterium]|nr:PEP-CTERM sorting domain-containing protein [Pseudomonadota bacterium]